MSLHDHKFAPGRAAASTVHLDRATRRADPPPVLLDPDPDHLLKSRFRFACDAWKRRTDGTRAQFADALGVAELTVKHWLSSDETRKPPQAMVIAAEELADCAAELVTPAEIGQRLLELLAAERRLNELKRRFLEGAA